MGIDVGPFQMVTAIETGNAVVTQYHVITSPQIGGIDFDIQILEGSTIPSPGEDALITIGEATFFVNFFIGSAFGFYSTNGDFSGAQYSMSWGVEAGAPDPGYIYRYRFHTLQGNGLQPFMAAHEALPIEVGTTGSIIDSAP